MTYQIELNAPIAMEIGISPFVERPDGTVIPGSFSNAFVNAGMNTLSLVPGPILDDMPIFGNYLVGMRLIN